MDERQSDIRPGAEVFDAEDEKVGDIGDFHGGYARVDTGFMGLGIDYYIPADAFTRIDDARMRVNVAKREFESNGWLNEPPSYKEGRA
jgi:hypothetical protein